MTEKALTQIDRTSIDILIVTFGAVIGVFGTILLHVEGLGFGYHVGMVGVGIMLLGIVSEIFYFGTLLRGMFDV